MFPEQQTASGPSASAASALDPSRRKKKKKVRVRIRIRVPRVKRGTKRALIRRYSVAAETKGIQTQVYAHGTQTLLQTSADDISGSGTNCSASGNGRICSFMIAAPPGDDDFVFKTYDAVPVGGSIPVSANQIGAGVATQTILEGTAPTVPVTLGGVVSSIALTVTPPAIHTMIQQTATLQVFAEDADGGAIVGSYVDASGNPISIAFSASNSGCCPALNFTPASLSSPSTSGVLVSYNGNFAGNGTQTDTISATPSGGSASAANATLDLVDPNFTAVSDSNLNQTGSFFGGMAYDAGSLNLYYTFRNGNGGIGAYSISSQTLADYSAPNTIAGGLADDTSTGMLYFTGPGGLYNFTAGSSGTFGTECGVACAGSGSAVALDPSGNRWYGNGSNLYEVPQAGPAPTVSPAPGAPLYGIAVDSTADHAVWMANASSGANVLWYDPVAPASGTVSMNNSNELPFDVMVDAGGNVWVTATSGDLIEIDPTTKSVTNDYSVGNIPYYIVQDPVQTNVYYWDYLSGGSVGVGRLDVSGNGGSGSWEQVNYPTCCPVQQPGAMAVVNGLVYMIDDGNQQLLVVQP